jgi:hypothetical protein
MHDRFSTFIFRNVIICLLYSFSWILIFWFDCRVLCTQSLMFMKFMSGWSNTLQNIHCSPLFQRKKWWVILLQVFPLKHIFSRMLILLLLSCLKALRKERKSRETQGRNGQLCSDGLFSLHLHDLTWVTVVHHVV